MFYSAQILFCQGGGPRPRHFASNYHDDNTSDVQNNHGAKTEKICLLHQRRTAKEITDMLFFATISQQLFPAPQEMGIFRFSWFALVVFAVYNLAAVSSMKSTSLSNMRLRGGGILSDLAESLGWKRSKVSPTSLGCGPLPQKQSTPSDSTGIVRSSSAIVPDIADCESYTAKPPKSK